jgi:hypothetical protein
MHLPSCWPSWVPANKALLLTVAAILVLRDITVLQAATG